MNVTLRKASHGDAGLLVRWRNENAAAFPPRDSPLTPGEHWTWWQRRYLRDPSDHLYMACIDHISAGCLSLTIRDGQGEVGRVILGDKTRARTGIMTAALRLLMDSYGLPAYWLRVLPGNTAAIGLYERCGFRPDGEKDGFLIMRSGT